MEMTLRAEARGDHPQEEKMVLDVVDEDLQILMKL
jgi:hypothetical protein